MVVVTAGTGQLAFQGDRKVPAAVEGQVARHHQQSVAHLFGLIGEAQQPQLGVERTEGLRRHLGHQQGFEQREKQVELARRLDAALLEEHFDLALELADRLEQRQLVGLQVAFRRAIEGQRQWKAQQSFKIQRVGRRHRVAQGKTFRRGELVAVVDTVGMRIQHAKPSCTSRSTLRTCAQR